MRNTLLFTFCLIAMGSMFLAQAGPPLICHPFQIGDQQSLPWGSGSDRDWDNPSHSYNTKNLATDTLAILDATPAVLVRMETLRRAAIYASADREAASSLIAQLKTRKAAAEKSTKPAATAFFDYGYFLSTIKQLQYKTKDDLSGGVDGYPFIAKALSLDPDAAEMHFAAAIVASWPQRPSERDEHLRKARAARNDSLLAQNLTTHFQ